MKTVAALVHEAWTAGKAGDEVAAHHLGIQAARMDRRHAERGEKVKALSEALAQRGATVSAMVTPPPGPQCRWYALGRTCDCLACVQAQREVDNG